MDKVVHFEIPVDDLARAKKFYSIFGWDIQDMPGMDYTAIMTSAVDADHMPKERGTINGGMMKRTQNVKSPVIAINVDSVEEAQKKVKAAGGKVVQPTIEIPNMGYYAYVQDTEGNIIGLWESMK